MRSLTHPVLYNQQNVTNHGPHRPFGENQLSLGSISILPLTTSHLKSLQRLRVRASHRLSSVFALLEVSSPSFGSSSYSKRAIHTRFPYASPQNVVRQGITENSPAHSSIGTRSPDKSGSHGLSANSFRFYFIGRLAQLFTFPSRY